VSEALKVYEQLCKDKHIENNIKQKDLVIELGKFLSGSRRNFIKKLFRYNFNQKKMFLFIRRSGYRENSHYGFIL